MINIDMEGIRSLPSVPSHHKNSLPKLSGLYFVVVQTPDPQLLYLGKASNFLQRWRNHHRQPEISLIEKLGLITNIHWLELHVADEALDQWEKQLIKDLCPTLNETSTMMARCKRLVSKANEIEKTISRLDFPTIPYEFELDTY